MTQQTTGKAHTKEGFFLYTDETIQEDVPREIIHAKIDASVEVIDDSAFKDCRQLQTVDFSDAKSLIMISEEAFAGCVSLKEADLTGTSELRFIFHKAFQGCISLQTIGKLPAKLDRIGEHAFDPEKDMEAGQLELDFSSAESLKFIYKGACANCNFKNAIKFPPMLEAIAEEAFEASSMQRLDFSCAKSLRFIGRSAFSDSRIEGQVKFPSMLETIDDNAFNGSTFSQIDFSSAAWLKKIGVSAFADCKFESEVRLPARLETLCEEAFSGSSMQRLDLSGTNKLKIIDRWSFARCTIEKDVMLSSTLEGISQRSFTGSSMHRLDFALAESLHVIGHAAFADCKIEEEVKLPAALEEIWPRAFFQARTSIVNVEECVNKVRRQSLTDALRGCRFDSLIGLDLDSDIESKQEDENDGDSRVEAAEASSAEEHPSTEPKEAAEHSSAEEQSPAEDSEPKKSVPIDDTMKLNLEEKAPESPDDQNAAPPSGSNSSFVKQSGWLEKKSRKRSMFLQDVWERRYFVLQDGVLTYSRNKYFGEEGVKTKSLSNVVIEKSGVVNYEVRDRDTSKVLLVLRLPEQGSNWDPKRISSMVETEETSRSISQNSLALPEQSAIQVTKLNV